MRPLLCHSLVLLLIASLPSSARAAWPVPPLSSLPVCTATGLQADVAIVSDGAGGALLAWDDFRSGDCDIYVQHVLASGAVDPAWPADGRAIMVLGGYQLRPHVVADGAGGMILAWTDHRGASWDIYAIHVLASGNVDPGWPATGVALCTEAGDQNMSDIVSDAAGGAFVVWSDLRSGEYDVYAHHVEAGGTVDPAIPANGLAVCALAGVRGGSSITSDGAGGALIAWGDERSGTDSDVYATRLLASGSLDPAWPSGGRALCTAPGGQGNEHIVPDGTGGAVVAWSDFRSGTGDIYAQRVSSAGVVDPAWPLDGRALCTATGDQFGGLLVADGAGGAVVTWDDMRNSMHSDIYAQRVSGAGVVNPAWPAQGRALCAAPGGQYMPVPMSDGAGGALVVWWDLRNGRYQPYIQHVFANGTLDPGWDADGELVVLADNEQIQPQVIADGTGSAIVAWADFRNGIDYDVHAQRMSPPGGVLDVSSPPASGRAARLAIQAVSPNPARGGRLALRATITSGRPVRARVLDLAGRIVLERELPAPADGMMELELGGASLRPGVYLLELQQEGARATTNFTYLK
ncbi:MAG: hypothetical protein IT348_04480 [Candidatus Eisenbacteria bacterium]|nr:hypothetical protein [Candidatus Eisenbacteria bacterium]